MFSYPPSLSATTVLRSAIWHPSPSTVTFLRTSVLPKVPATPTGKNASSTPQAPASAGARLSKAIQVSPYLSDEEHCKEAAYWLLVHESQTDMGQGKLRDCYAFRSLHWSRARVWSNSSRRHHFPKFVSLNFFFSFSPFPANLDSTM